MPAISIRTDLNWRRRFVFPVALLLVAGSLIVGLGPIVCAQSEIQEKPTLKDFGSSLKRLKWDPQKNAAVRLPSTDDVANSEDDVIRIDTSLVSCGLRL